MTVVLLSLCACYYLSLTSRMQTFFSFSTLTPNKPLTHTDGPECCLGSICTPTPWDGVYFPSGLIWGSATCESFWNMSECDVSRGPQHACVFGLASSASPLWEEHIQSSCCPFGLGPEAGIPTQISPANIS